MQIISGHWFGFLIYGFIGFISEWIHCGVYSFRLVSLDVMQSLTLKLSLDVMQSLTSKLSKCGFYSTMFLAMFPDPGNRDWMDVILVLHLLVWIADVLLAQDALLARVLDLFSKTALSSGNWMALSGARSQTCFVKYRRPRPLQKDPFRARWIGGRRFKHPRYAFTDGRSSNIK